MGKKISGIYTITNTVNGKVYLGQSTNIYKRWEMHKWGLKNNKHPNSHLQNAYNKYGDRSFIYKIKEAIDDIPTLLSREIELIKELKLTDINFGYNKMTECGVFERTPETTQKIKHSGKINGLWMHTYNKIKNSNLEMIAREISEGNLEPYTGIEKDLVSDFCNISQALVDKYCNGIKVDPSSLTAHEKMEYSTKANDGYNSCVCDFCSYYSEFSSGVSCKRLRVYSKKKDVNVTYCPFNSQFKGDFSEEYGNYTIDEITEKWQRGELY